jgi:D-3-phosphoglycerate dehydrogenase
MRSELSYRVLVSAPYFQPVVDRFRSTFDEHGIEIIVPYVEERLSAKALMSLVTDIDGAICGDDEFTAEVLANAPRLRVISKWGTGIDSIDGEECARRGIAVCNTPNAFSEPVADTTLGYILSFVRALGDLSNDVHQGRWRKQPARALGECTVGLIGVGNVGRAVGRRLAACGAKIVACDPITPPATFLETCAVELMGKEALLASSDIVSLHCDLNPTSLHIMDAAAFCLMKNGSFLVNTARGRLVDEPALIAALQNDQLAGAALDVFEVEPLPSDSPLCAMNNVFLAPHNANSSPEAWERVHSNTVNNLIKHLSKAG